jgi:hypothetical protein
VVVLMAGIELRTYCVILSAGAMLIFSVLFQIDQMPTEVGEIH